MYGDSLNNGSNDYDGGVAREECIHWIVKGEKRKNSPHNWHQSDLMTTWKDVCRLEWRQAEKWLRQEK